MGAWGYGPLDNDTGADWMYGLSEIGLFDLIESGITSSSYDEARAAIWLFQQLSVSAYVYDVDRMDGHRDLAIKKIQEILNDSDWLEAWDSQSEVEAGLKSTLSQLQADNP